MTKQIAARGDWKIHPMPEACASVELDRDYSLSEFEKICEGVVPRQMEDKWFVFHEVPWLYVHRSWTGFCIFEARFAQADDRVSIAEVRVNMDSQQHTGGSDPTLLGILLDGWAGRDVRGAFMEWIKQRSKPE